VDKFTIATRVTLLHLRGLHGTEAHSIVSSGRGASPRLRRISRSNTAKSERFRRSAKKGAGFIAASFSETAVATNCFMLTPSALARRSTSALTERGSRSRKETHARVAHGFGAALCFFLALFVRAAWGAEQGCGPLADFLDRAFDLLLLLGPAGLDSLAGGFLALLRSHVLSARFSALIAEVGEIGTGQ